MREKFKSTLEFAYGFMGMSPHELSGYTLHDFSLKSEGFARKLKSEESLFRNVAWFSLAPHIGKNSRGIDYYWPMSGNREGALFTKKQIDANLKAYKEIRNKRLNAALNLN